MRDPRMDVLWKLEPSTAAKHRLYGCYRHLVDELTRWSFSTFAEILPTGSPPRAGPGCNRR